MINSKAGLTSGSIKPASVGPLVLPLFSVVAAPLRLTVVATAPATEPGDEEAAEPLAPRPRTDKRADDAPADDGPGAEGAVLVAPPPEVAGLAAAIKAAEGPPEPPRGGKAPPPPEGCAGCQGEERPLWELLAPFVESEMSVGPESEFGAGIPWPAIDSVLPPPASPEGVYSGTTIPIGTELAGTAGALAMGVATSCAC